MARNFIWLLKLSRGRNDHRLNPQQLGKIFRVDRIDFAGASYAFNQFVGRNKTIADRFDRRWVLVGLITIWCIACAGSGFARNYTELLVVSGMVGVAESGISPIILAMIPMLFPAHRWQTANSIYAIVSTAGAAVTTALCGVLIANVESLRPLLPAALQAMDGWRLAFVAAALPAPLLMLMAFSMEPSGEVEVTKPLSEVGENWPFVRP